MDVHVRQSITDGLRRRGVDVLTAQEDGSATFDDARILDRATVLDRVLFSQDEDLLREAAQRQQSGKSFAGLAYSHPLRITDGKAIEDLELMAKVYDRADMKDRVEYLPL